MLGFVRSAALVAAVFTTGLTAGLFAAFSYGVMPGLRRVDDRAFVGTMRAINVAILNVWLALILGGGVAATATVVATNLGGPADQATGWLVAGLVFSLATLFITGLGNVPLNLRLDAGSAAPSDHDGLQGSSERIGTDAGRDREAFEAPWTRWNLARTVTSLVAFGCVLLAAVTS